MLTAMATRRLTNGKKSPMTTSRKGKLSEKSAKVPVKHAGKKRKTAPQTRSTVLRKVGVPNTENESEPDAGTAENRQIE